MMRLAWLVWWDEEEKAAGHKPELWLTEPDNWRAFTRIVYCEVTE